MPVSKNFTLETTHNQIEVRTAGHGKVEITVTEACDEENGFEVGNEATLRLRPHEVYELVEVLEHFKG